MAVATSTPSTTAPTDSAMAHDAVSYTHLRAHETVLDLVCRPLLEKKNMNPLEHSSTYACLTPRPLASFLPTS